MAQKKEFIKDNAWEVVQMKTFTKWCNNHLVKKIGKDAIIENIVEDWTTGIKLMQLLHALYGTSYPKKYYKQPKMRPQALDNIEQSFGMLKEAGVKTNFLKTEHLADSNKTMLLGMVWSIILHYQINAISVEEMSAKEGLLLWCQRKTKGYKDVSVKNFTNSWVDGLAFCALIHKHRPDLIDFDSLDKNDRAKNLETAFAVAEGLGIPRLLDVEDMDSPDERSVMTYVSEYFHYFSAQNQGEAAGKKIGKLVATAKSHEQLREDFLNKAGDLMKWIKEETGRQSSRDYDNSLEGIEDQFNKQAQYKKSIKPKKTQEKAEVETAYNVLQAKLKVSNRPPYTPPEELSIPAINTAWSGLGTEEQQRSKWINEELELQRRLASLASRFFRKAENLLRWGKENQSSLESTEFGTTLGEVQAKLKNHEGFESSKKAAENRYQFAQDLAKELLDAPQYGKKDKVNQKLGELKEMFSNIENLSNTRREGLQKELERQQKLEDIRLEFALKSRNLLEWIEDSSDVLAEPTKTGSLSAVKELNQTLDNFDKELEEKKSIIGELETLNNQLAESGSTANVYASQPLETIKERFEQHQKEAESRRQALSTETTRQEENDKLCQEFANALGKFVEFISNESKKLTEFANEADAQKQLEGLRNLQNELSTHRDQLSQLTEQNNSLEERGINNNPHTEENIVSATEQWNNLGNAISKQLNTIEQSMNEKNDSGVSEDELQEFKETFNTFDKDKSGGLVKHEFKGLLSALGEDLNDDQIDNLMQEICKQEKGTIYFDEFVEFMKKRRDTSDSADTMLNAFQQIANGKDFVTENEMKAVMEKDEVEYLVKNMKPLNEGFDYKEFIQRQYA